MNSGSPSGVERGNLDAQTAALLDSHGDDRGGLQAVLFGRCWPNTTRLPDDLPLAGGLHIELETGETVKDAVLRLGHGWSPQWLFDAGHRAIDANGTILKANSSATVTGPITWDPIVRLARVEDGISKGSTADAQKRRLAGEVATAALWRRAAVANGIGAEGVEDIRPENDLGGNARGARFKNALLYALRRKMPSTWQLEGELALEKIYGLHLRRDVGTRSSDIVVFDERKRLVAVVSSKWTWRSDRGTEAAQMVPLRRYRPDVPYVMVTAEFPRLRSLSRESAEDRVYSVCPEWASAAAALRELDNCADGPSVYPRLVDLEAKAQLLIEILDLKDVSRLITDLSTSGRLG
jgi:hypothetical protein